MAQTYRSLGNDLYEIEGPGGRRIPVRLSPGQLEAAGYVADPMPSPQAFAGPGAAETYTLTEQGLEPQQNPTEKLKSEGARFPEPKSAEQQVAEYLAQKAPPPAPPAPPPPVLGTGGAGGGGSGRPPGQTAGKPVEGTGGVGTGPVTSPPVAPPPETTAHKIPTAGAGEKEAGEGQLPLIMPRGGGGGGPRLPPGTMVPGRQDVETTRYDPEAMERWRVAREEQSQDIAAGLLRVSQEHTAYAAKLEQEARDADDLGKMQRAHYNRALAEFEQERAAIASEQIDPGKYYTDRGVVATILAAIMRGAGEYAATIDRSGRNPVAEIIEAGIDRDIDAQKANHAARMQGLSTKMTLLDRYLENNDPKIAEALARSNMKEVWVHQLEATKNEAALAEIQSSARADVAELEAKAGMQKVSTTLVPVKATGGGGGGHGPVDPNILVKSGMDPRQAVWMAENDPAQARAIAKQFYTTGATMAAKGMGAGSAMAKPIRGYIIADPRMHRMAVGFDAAEASAEAAQKMLLSKLEEFKKAPLGSAQRQKLRQETGTLYRKVLEANGKVDVGVSAFGASQALREYLVPQIAKELGPDVSESEWSNFLSDYNPLQQSNVDRLATGVRQSMATNRNMVDKRLKAYAEGGSVADDPGIQIAEAFGVADKFGIGGED